jgi:hypothetical protein
MLAVRNLKEWRIDGKMLLLIRNFMKDRSLKVAVGNTLSKRMKIENGVVQGAILSVTLFLVAMAKIYKGIAEQVTKKNHPTKPKQCSFTENDWQSNFDLN